jgi:HSP20 family protein
MMLVRWNPAEEIAEMQRYFDRVFNELSDWKANQTQGYIPPVELSDQETSLVLKVVLPGWEAKDLDISITRNTVTIKGEYTTTETNDKIYYSELSFSAFERSLKLPVAVENDKAKADFKNGILTLTLPKVPEVINQVIKLNLTGEES